MFRILAAKDLRRILRNPWPLVINLALPLCVTGLIGLTFGSANKPSGLGRIKLAVVDEDQSILSQFLSSVSGQQESQKYLQMEWLNREAALQRIQANAISAVVVIPKDFSAAFLEGNSVPPLELIKNPAQSYYPAIVEELLGVAIEGLNGLHRNFQGELRGWSEVFDTDGAPRMIALSKIILDLGNKFERAEDYLFPPLVTYGESTHQTGEKKQNDMNVFGYLLPGLASMFLFFIVDNCVRDLYREMRLKTLNRYRTLHVGLFPFILSKVGYALVVGVLSAGILFGVGGIMFAITWKSPFPLALLATAFALFAAGFTAFLAALAKREDRADMMNNVLILGISFVGGSFFPSQQLPGFLRDYVSPFMPNYWFVESVRNLQNGTDNMHWVTGVLCLSVGGVVFSAVASVLLNRFLRRGGQA